MQQILFSERLNIVTDFLLPYLQILVQSSRYV